MSLQTRPLSYALGAEILGIDLRKPLDAMLVNEIHRAFLEHSILLFRAQDLTREQHMAFSRWFGELDVNDAVIRLKDSRYPEIFLNNPERGKPAYFTDWHSDQSFTLIPAMVSLLRGIEVPDVGGDTMFANMYLAYDTLSDGMKKLIDGLYGVHIGGNKRIDNSTPERAAETRRLVPPIAQPIVRVHPETGRKALYVSERVKQIVGMTAAESKPLAEYLFRHASRPQFVYRHQWRNNDLVMWDNRCTMHIALGDYDNTQTRHMERTTIKGTPSGYVYEGPLQ